MSGTTGDWLEDLRRAQDALDAHRREVEEVLTDVRRAVAGLERLGIKLPQRTAAAPPPTTKPKPEEEPIPARRAEPPAALPPAPEVTHVERETEAGADWRRRIVAWATDRKPWTAAELVKALDMSQATTKYHLTALRRLGIVKMTGERNHSRYQLVPREKWKPKPPRLEHVVMAFTEMRNGRFVMGDFRREFEQKLGSATLSSTVYAVLAALTREGKLRKVGPGEWGLPK